MKSRMSVILLIGPATLDSLSPVLHGLKFKADGPAWKSFMCYLILMCL